MTGPRLAAVLVALFAAFPFAGMGGARLEAQVHQCSYCHDVHGGFTSSTVALNREEVVQDVCMTCHGDAGPGYLIDGSTVNSTKDFQLGVHAGNLHAVGDTTSCWDCHDHEGAAQGNLFMIPRNFELPQGGTATVVFTSNTTQADFTGTDGLCYVCHTQTATQTTGLNGHNGPDVCTTCHAHEGGFQASGGGCTACHSSQRGNHRPVVPEFDRASHHVQLGGAGSEIPDADCTTCHDQTGHPRAGTDYVVLVDHDGGPTISYDYRVNPTSTLTPFCISCHDADGGAGGDTSPFSDGIVRPLIDETAWLASSHEGSTAAQCADCHEGHGSEKVRLLTPGNVIPNATTKYEEEEGFCLGCHDSDGPSTVDLATAFAKPVNWVQIPTGLNANPYLNDRHDIEWAVQDSTGAKLECISCHNPHTASTARPWILDPDPNDGHVPGTDWYFAEYQAFGDTLSEFCLDCHDGSVSNGVVEGHGGLMTNIRTTWVNDGMGARNSFSGATLRLGTGWDVDPATDPNKITVMRCIDCHVPHVEIDNSTTANGATTLFRLTDQNYSPDYTLELYFEGRKPPPIYDYGVTNNQSSADETSGGYWCNTCHDRSSMTGKVDCYSCHRHGDGGRF